MKRIFHEFIKFSFVGASGVLVNLTVLYFFTEFLKVYYIISALFAFLVALTSNFILNKIWTFGEGFRYKTFHKYGKYFVVNVFALIINLVFLFLFTEFIGFHYMISQLIAIGIALFINFTGNKLLTFSKY